MYTQNFSCNDVAIAMALFIYSGVFSTILYLRKTEKRPRVIVVDGIIGAGKTTLIQEGLVPFYEKLGKKVTAVLEPVNKWRESGRLQQFYADPQKRAYQFQTGVFHDRVREAQQKFRGNPDTDIFILERSIFTDLLFMEMLLESGMVDKTQYDDYLSLWTMWREVMPFEPDMFIYLKPTIDACMDRLRKRNRDGESTVSEEYQRDLEKKHNAFFNSNTVPMGDKRVPRVILETNANFRDDPVAREELCEQIRTAVEEKC